MLGRLIIVEGPDGAGKTTLVKKIHERLQQAGYNATQLQEPGTSAFGLDIRKITEKFTQTLDTKRLVSDERAVHPEAMANLYRAASVQLFESRVIPALKRGEVVIMDRCYFTSSPIYQDLKLEDLVLSNALTYIANAFFAVIIADSETLIARRPDEDLERLKRVRDGYIKLAGEKKCKVYDTTNIDVTDALYNDIIAYLDPFSLDAPTYP